MRILDFFRVLLSFWVLARFWDKRLSVLLDSVKILSWSIYVYLSVRICVKTRVGLEVSHRKEPNFTVPITNKDGGNWVCPDPGKILSPSVFLSVYMSVRISVESRSRLERSNRREQNFRYPLQIKMGNIGFVWILVRFWNELAIYDLFKFVLL